ncbi:hypothetical protein [uncultured Paraglaciecola sp.]|jgi:hypothetical protein|uniref:hypothetical protein n=1 Tax=uncultured Paraglaciecola sp. TaxID=1765024 RepID=UPI0025EAEDC6|nr:hypothetical protein [uncultured Paraglaciecola sp.]
MRLILITFITFLLFSNSVQADYDNVWLELSHSLSSTGVNLKAVEGNFNWAIEGAVYYSPIFTLYEDRDTQQTKSTTFTTLGVTKNWSSIGNWGYLDLGVGLGIGKGTWVTNCEKGSHSGLFGSTELCNIHNGIRVGVPLHASAVFGKYFGIGISAKAFISSGQSHANLMVTFPFGDFTK